MSDYRKHYLSLLSWCIYTVLKGYNKEKNGYSIYYEIIIRLHLDDYIHRTASILQIDRSIPDCHECLLSSVLHLQSF
jgi:hypothetical protein